MSLTPTKALDRLATDYPDEFSRFFLKAVELYPEQPYFWPDTKLVAAFSRIYGAECGWSLPWQKSAAVRGAA